MDIQPKFRRIDKNYLIICEGGGIGLNEINTQKVFELFGEKKWELEFENIELDVVDIYDILVKASIFKSKGDARKNWTRTGKEIPWGFNDFENIGKLKHRIVIYKPFDTEKFKLNKNGTIEKK
jgi:hypothetical protein